VIIPNINNLLTMWQLSEKNTHCGLKVILISLYITLALTTESFSKNYYFSSSTGNDSYSSTQAQNTTTPWKSIDQLNRSMSLFAAGDFIYFKRGDIFYGQILLTRSGTSAARITFDAYGTGATPIITGNAEISGWTRFNGNIWVAGCPASITTVSNFLINGKSQQIGRFPNANAPNKGYLNITSHSGSSQLTSSSLSSSPDWTGGVAVVRTRRWILDRVTIQSHQGNILNFSGATTYEMYDNYGFFIQNHITTLDLDGEWYFDAINKRIYLFSSGDPNSFKTEISALSSTFTASNQKYFSIHNLELRGSVNTNLKIVSSSYFDVTNNVLSESGTDAAVFQTSNHVSFEGNRIVNTNNIALVFDNSSSIVASSNELHNTGMRAGMGKKYIGLWLNNSIRNLLFDHNLVDSIGYHGLMLVGDSLRIKNNVVANFCMTVDDGGGIYTFGDGVAQHYTRELESNLVSNGIGAPTGTDQPDYKAASGIYLDDRSFNVSVKNNTISTCSEGIFIHNSNNLSVDGNTVFNNETQLLLKHDNIASDFPINNCSVSNNIFFSKSDLQLVADFRTIDNGIKNFGTFRNNYYCRPVDDDVTIHAEYPGTYGTTSSDMDLSAWQSFSNYDSDSRKSPCSIPRYKIINLVSQNKIPNGKFNTSTTGWGSWSNYNNGFVSWDNTNKLDGGSLKLGFSSSSSGKQDPMSIALGSCGAAVAGRSYILKFSMISSYPGTIVKVYMENERSPYKLLTSDQAVSIGINRKEFEILLVPGSSDSYARVDFQLKYDQGPVWIDNVELYEANIEYTNIDTYLKFLYNSSSQQVTNNLNASYIDVKNTKYQGNITLLPFTSAILILDPDPSNVPLTPEYINSVVENSNPSRLEMTYSLSLANIIPNVSAFEVRVNSTVRSINSISVSGTKVQLNLTTPVLYGDIVTVSYSMPVSNALQTPEGGKAASLSARPVTNHVGLADSSSTPEKEHALKIYPNPSSGLITVAVGDRTPVPDLIEVTNTSGEIVYKNRINAYDEIFQIHLDLSQGLYFVKMISKGITLDVRKLIIVH
jgi:parallel beta-helix repeat protein